MPACYKLLAVGKHSDKGIEFVWIIITWDARIMIKYIVVVAKPHTLIRHSTIEELLDACFLCGLFRGSVLETDPKENIPLRGPQ
jgi:hypothetical protein